MDVPVVVLLHSASFASRLASPSVLTVRCSPVGKLASRRKKIKEKKKKNREKGSTIIAPHAVISRDKSGPRVCDF